MGRERPPPIAEANTIKEKETLLKNPFRGGKGRPLSKKRGRKEKGRSHVTCGVEKGRFKLSPDQEGGKLLFYLLHKRREGEARIFL